MTTKNQQRDDPQLVIAPTAIEFFLESVYGRHPDNTRVADTIKQSLSQARSTHTGTGLNPGTYFITIQVDGTVTFPTEVRKWLDMHVERARSDAIGEVEAKLPKKKIQPGIWYPLTYDGYDEAITDVQIVLQQLK